MTGLFRRRIEKSVILKRFIIITIGAIIMAIGLEDVLMPNNMIDGGITGVSMIVSHTLHLNLGLLLILLNIPFLILGYKRIGKLFSLSMLYGLTVLSVATHMFANMQPFITDSLLATVFGGIIVGTGVGIVMRGGGVLDGTETLSILLEKKLPFSVGEIILFINVIIFSISAFVFSLPSALYSMLTYYIASKTIDIVVKGLEDAMAAYIITDKPEDMALELTEQIGRSVTYLHGEGSYSGDYKKVLLCVFTRIEETQIKELIKSIDMDAFVIINNVSEVRGGRFTKNGVH